MAIHVCSLPVYLPVGASSANGVLKLKRNICYSRQVVWYVHVESSYTPCSMYVMAQSTDKMASWKPTMMHVLGHNSPVVAHMQL